MAYRDRLCKGQEVYTPKGMLGVLTGEREDFNRELYEVDFGQGWVGYFWWKELTIVENVRYVRNNLK